MEDGAKLSVVAAEGLYDVFVHIGGKVKVNIAPDFTGEDWVPLASLEDDRLKEGIWTEAVQALTELGEDVKSGLT